MWALIVAVVTIFSFLTLIFGYFLFTKNWKTNSKLERECSRFYKDLSSSREYFIQKTGKKPLIIVETEGKYENIRTFIKKLIIRAKGGESPKLIYVFHQDTFEEKQAYLIRELISNEWNQIKILDFAFLDAMINYFAYKYTHRKKDISETVKNILREKYETCAYRDCIVRLDDPDYEDEVVINLPPKKKPILHDIILPLAIDQNRKAERKSFHAKEALKTKLMEIIDEIYQCNCAILFIGELPVGEYCEMLRNSMHRYDFLLLSARGHQTFVLDNIFEAFIYDISDRRYHFSSFEGTYFFRGEKSGKTNYKYTFLKKITY